ncbi:hypothetical protein EYZ11_002443 [Aspergillus tanneri]|uniref:Uncharacterized protein n=1 Tax=Aspergillus tanneri TaxID=1220188 RepID=A0A4S3JU31_9EURO|nr:hypothetical protein EYZ11_002443 [Aspergillus tanneri]
MKTCSSVHEYQEFNSERTINHYWQNNLHRQIHRERHRDLHENIYLETAHSNMQAKGNPQRGKWYIRQWRLSIN